MPLTTRQPPAEPVKRKSFFRETLELWREVHDRYRRKPADIPVKANKPGGGKPSSTPLTTNELLSLMAAEDYPENLKGKDVEIQMDERGWVLLPFQLLKISDEDRARSTLRGEPVDRETFYREMAELSREIHERYRRKAAD
jgi:hypothetical protein